MTDRKIITDYWAKPIPPRQFDWTAWFAVGIVAMAIIILGSLVWPLFVDTP